MNRTGVFPVGGTWWRILALCAAISLAACSDSTDPGEAGGGGGAPGQPDVVDGGGGTAGDPGEPDTGVPPEPDVVETPDTGEPDPTEDGVLRILTVDPNRGLATGLEQVEITGTGFHDNIQVFFGESQAEDVFVLDGERMAVLTPPRVPGLVDVRVTDPNPDAPQTSVIEDGFLFFNPVEIVAIDPPSGHVFGGEAVTLTGTGFIEGSQVLIGGKAAISVEVIDDNTIFAVTPESAKVGEVDVFVSNNLGIATLVDGFLYFEPPKLTSVFPPVGLVAGGTVVEVSGSGFVEPIAVTFGGKPLEELELESSERIVGIVPAADAAGSVDVQVSTPYGADTADNAFTYLDEVAPGTTVEVLTVTPGHGPFEGGNLATVVANGLTTKADTTIRFGGTPASIKGVDPVNHAALVIVPEGSVGLVDVSVDNSNGSDTLADAYEYQPFIKVTEIAPTYGPVVGGTAVTIKGEGFFEGVTVNVGALPATDVVIVDDTTITAVTPPGSAGLANVTVYSGDLKDTLVGGYLFQPEGGGMNLWVVDPPQGSQAGGTLVHLYGSGFPADAKVLFDGFPATHLKVVSPTEITCKTPPNEIGTVDVEVVSDQKGTVELPLAYTYYNPESLFGGTWGGEVDGDLNVSVLNGADGSGIPDAFVIVGVDPDTPYQGFTNSLGQITFSGPDLEDEQMISASKEGFASNSVVEYDATNVTIYLIPTTPPNPGAPPSVEPPMVIGQVVNASKYVPIPWGQCADKINAPGALCDPCETNDDCGGSMNCSQLPMQNVESGYCTQHCATNADCPDGFMCYPLNGVPEDQCVPSAGEVTAFCDFTNPTIFSDDLLPSPGLQVNEDWSFELPVPLGEFAVYCWGGIWEPGNVDSFKPYAVGFIRHVFAQPGQIIEEDVVLNHPLNRDLVLRLDIPDSGVPGTDFNAGFLYLDLGSDGTLQFLDTPFSWGDGILDMTLPATGFPENRVAKIPKVLNGDLYDASYTFLVGAIANSGTGLPQSFTLHQDITKIDDDTMYVYGPEGWEARASGVTRNINGLWGMSAEDIIGVGSDGLIIRSIGTAWASQPSGTTQHLQDVHGIPSGEAIAVGDGGTATHYNGTVWTVTPTGTTSPLTGVWMAAPNDAYAVGWYQVRHWDGVEWTQMTGNTSKNLSDVWGFASDDVWAVGTYGQVIRYDGVAWNNITTGTTQNLRSVWGSSPDDVFMVGEGGTILHWDGVEVLPMPVDTLETLEAVWGSGPSDVVAVGARGTILRYDGVQWNVESPPGYTSAFLAVGGAEGTVYTTGTHELLLGPIMAIPQNIKPSNGGTMGEDYKISWDADPNFEDPHFSYVLVAVPGLMGPVPEWITINDWYVKELLLPDMPNIEGTPGIAPGSKILRIMRVYKEGFDIDNYSNMDLGIDTWRSWSVEETTFTKQ